MKRLFLSGVASLLGVLVLQVSPAAAQYIPPGIPAVGPGNRPLLNPYLNLLRSSNGLGTTGANGVFIDPAIDYFMGTVPETQRRANFNQVQTEIGRLEYAQRATAGSVDEIDQLLTPLRATGHPAVFANTGGYFGNSRVANRPLLQQQQPGGAPRVGTGTGTGGRPSYR